MSDNPQEKRPTCGGCHWYLRKGEGEHIGWCYRYPPNPVNAQLAEGPTVGEKRRACGEYEPNAGEVETKAKYRPPTPAYMRRDK